MLLEQFVSKEGRDAFLFFMHKEGKKAKGRMREGLKVDRGDDR